MNKSSRAPLLIIFITVFIDLLGFGIVLPLLPRYAEHFRVTGGTIGLLMASFSAMQFLFAPVWGRISDRVGRRPILILGLAGSALFYTLFGYATSLGFDGRLLGLGVVPWLFICRIGAGIAGATIPTAQAYIADVTGPHERARGMALIGAAFGIGFTFGPLLGAPFVPDARPITAEVFGTRSATTEPAGAGELPETDGELLDDAPRNSAADQSAPPTRRGGDKSVDAAPPSSAPGYVAGILSALGLLSAVFLLPESLTAAGQAQERHWFDLRSFEQAVAHPAIGLVLLTMFSTVFAFAQFESTLSLLTEHLGLSVRENYYVFAYIGFILSLSQGLLVRRLVPRLGERRMCIVGTVLMTLGLALIGVSGISRSTVALCCILPVAVVGFSAVTPSLQSLLSRHTAATQQGGMLGLGQSISALARILGPWLGLLLQARDMLRPYWVGASIMGLSILLTIVLSEPAATTDAGEHHA